MQTEELFIEAYERHNDALFRYCYFRVYDRERALDIVQEAYTKVWSSLADGARIVNLRAFLYTTVRNLIIDQSRKKTAVSLDELSETGFDPAARPDDHETAIDAKQAVAVMNELDEPYREAVYLRYVDGLKPKEIAELMDETQNVISVRINRGIKQLRNLLRK